MATRITNQKLSKSSRAWMREHLDDPFLKKAQKEGYRARAAYKLLEIQEKSLHKPLSFLNSCKEMEADANRQWKKVSKIKTYNPRLI